MKRLFLTGTKRVLTEEAEKRLEEFKSMPDIEPTDEDGRNADWFRDMGIPVPKTLLEKTDTFENGIELDPEKDYDLYEVDITINMSEFEMCENDIEDGSVVHLKSGKYLEVLEDSADINAQIWYNTRSRWEKIQEWWLMTIRKFKKKNKINK